MPMHNSAVDAEFQQTAWADIASLVECRRKEGRKDVHLGITHRTVQSQHSAAAISNDNTFSPRFSLISILLTSEWFV